MAHVHTLNLPFLTMSRPAMVAKYLRRMRESVPT